MASLKQATQSRSEATSARIVAAAKTLFVSKNYAEITTDMIANAAGVTKGGLYHHFPSKENLYVSMMLDDFERKHDLFSNAVAAPGTSRDRLAQLTMDFLTLPEEERKLARLVRRDINVFTGEQRDQLVRGYQRSLPEQIESIIRDGVRDGELAADDPKIMSWWFVGLVEVAVSQYANDALGSASSRLEHILDLFFEGAAAQPNGGER